MLKKYAATIAFIALAIGTAVGFWRVEQLATQVEKESVARAQALCEKDNDTRRLLGTTLRSLFEGSEEKDFSEELASIDERLTALESTVLAPTDCAQEAETRRES